MGPEKVKIISSLVRRVAQKFEDIGICHNQLTKETANDFQWFFLGLDESTNVTDYYPVVYSWSQVLITQEVWSNYRGSLYE